MMTTLDLNLYDKVDENDDLELYHFNYDYDYKNENMKLKGIVVDKETKNVICSTSLHTIEYDVQNVEYIPNINDIDWNKSVVMLSHEGCFLRVFNHNDQWYISTHRKLDSNNSRWGSKHSFKVLFISALVEIYGENFDLYKDFLNKLDINIVYTFLLRNDQTNRIVSNAPSTNEAKIYFTGIFPKGDEHTYIPSLTLQVEGETFLDKISVSSVVPVTSLTDIVQFVGNQSYENYQGVIVFTRIENQTHIFKIMCPKYLENKEIRNNCSNLLYRYAQLRNNHIIREKIIDLFPYYAYDFFQFENTLSKISIYITNQYINRFLKKQYAAVTPLQYKITKKLREWYLQNTSCNHINSDVVLQFINEESPLYVYKLVIEFNK